jgi:nicotinamidase-related amidase
LCTTFNRLQEQEKMANSKLDLSRAALLSMDLQNAIVANYLKGQEDLLARAASVLAAARERGTKVIHVQVGFRPGLPEISPRNQLFGAIKSSVEWQRMFDGPAGAIHSAVAPQGDDIVVTKHRVSAFSGSDLEMILRANEVDTLVLQGIATSGVVLSTLLEASDRDYRLVVAKDCCLDQDPEVHACLMEKIFPRRGAVLTAGEIAEALRAG